MEIDDERKVMKITNKKVIEECMVRIKTAQEHISALEMAGYFIRDVRRYRNVEYGNIRDLLIEIELDEWRNLAAWGLTLNDAERDRVKAAVYQRFLRDGMSVGKWLGNGIEPSQWLVSEEEDFREMARKAFGPKDER